MPQKTLTTKGTLDQEGQNMTWDTKQDQLSEIYFLSHFRRKPFRNLSSQFDGRREEKIFALKLVDRMDSFMMLASNKILHKCHPANNVSSSYLNLVLDLLHSSLCSL